MLGRFRSTRVVICVLLTLTLAGLLAWLAAVTLPVIAALIIAAIEGFLLGQVGMTIGLAWEDRHHGR